MNKQEIEAKLSECEELIKKTQKAREDAIVAKSSSETKLNTSLDILKKNNVTPENAQAEIEKIDAQIESLFKELEDNIPIELLKDLKRIP